MTRRLIPALTARRMAVAFALVIATVSLFGCEGKTPEPPITNPDISGVIISIDSSKDTVSFRVVWTEAMGPRSDFQFDAVQVSTPKGLKVEDGTRSGAPPLSAADLKVGDIVAVYLTGPIAESYPPQATAKSVTYLGKHQGELPKVPGLEPPEATATP